MTGLPPVNVFFATVLWGTAALLIQHEIIPQLVGEESR
jgi:hypothetical protein